MYSVETDSEAQAQVDALPATALKHYAELMALLEIAPWSGDAYNRQRPDANMRAHPFGEHDRGLVIYLVLEDQRRVVVLRVSMGRAINQAFSARARFCSAASSMD